MNRVIPRGAVIAGLGRRVLAALIDVLPFFLISGLSTLAMRLSPEPTVVLVTGIAAAVLSLGFALYQWWAYASRGAGIGAQLTGLRLVSLKDGEPIGWWRVFLRYLVFGALMGTVVGGIALLIFLVIHERRQGWHDAAVAAVVVRPKPAESRIPAGAVRKPTQASTVGLPPHLSSTFSPQPGTTSSATQNWGSFAPSGSSSAPQPPQPQVQHQQRQQPMGNRGHSSNPPAPDWLPGVHSEPVQAPPSQPSAPQQAQFPATGQWQAPASWQSSGQSAGSASAPSAAPQPFPATPAPPVSGDSPKPPRAWIPLPTPTSVIEPSVKMRRRDFGEVEEDEGTRIAPMSTQAARGGDEGWYLRLDDGREVDLNVTVLLGRNPQKAADDPEVHLVSASGDGRMISRTHVQIGTDPRGVYVVDRGSTNGTALVTQSGDLEPCPAGTQMRVREGQQVSYGNRWFTVLRRPVVVA